MTRHSSDFVDADLTVAGQGDVVAAAPSLSILHSQELCAHLAIVGAWTPVLGRLSLPPELVLSLAARARANRTDFLAELTASGLVAEEDQYRALAQEFGVEFSAALDPSKLLITEEACVALLGHPEASQIARLDETDRPASIVIAPQRLDAAQMHRLVASQPSIRDRLRLTTPRALRAAVVERAGSHIIRRACSHLFENFPALSARVVANAWQGVFFGWLAVFLPVAFYAAPEWTSLAFHLTFSVFFLSCVALRLGAATTAAAPDFAHVDPIDPSEAPVYSVLVALYRETDIVPDLLVALGRLAWPRSKLEIKLVCEADDAATLAAIGAQKLRPWIEVVTVPQIGPRTKPKALAYALPFTSGEFVALFDAEDRPHPQQLAEAWQRFRCAGDDLAALQAPLVISNARDGLIARVFAFEYAALFRGLLPWLSSRRLVLPLGGTSNHFRRAALDRVCGWDPYNVTEDADLGLRLARFGYRTETITHPTYEDAAADWATWLPQRTRWFKGWMQTWLVHMRNPLRAAQDLGPRSFIVAQILFAGMAASALVHPVFAATALWLAGAFFLDQDFATFHSVLLLIDSANISLGYLAFLLLGYRTLLPGERRGFWKTVLFTPVYWMMMSVAAWRALFQLITDPHLWEKTHHTPRRQAARSHAQPSADAGGEKKDEPSPMIFGSSSPIAERSRSE